jgi:hypothetical protein
MELVSKITIKGLCGSVAKALQGKPVGDHITLLKVIGIANGAGTTPTQFGDSVFLKGQFKAVNLTTKDEQGSGKLYLPDSATNMIAGQFTDEVKSVQFALEIGAKVVEKRDGTLGYEYTIKPLLAAEPNNPIALLEQKLA